MLSKAHKWVSISIAALLLGNVDGRFFLRAFLLEEFLLGPSEICKMPCRQVSLTIDVPSGEPGGGFSCWDFREKKR